MEGNVNRGRNHAKKPEEGHEREFVPDMTEKEEKEATATNR